MPSVDVAIPCYQYGRYLRDCVASILTQELSDVRILIIDNASTDDTLEVARQLSTEDSRISVLARAQNCGPHASFNAGVDWAEADYFMILCADDLLSPGSLRRAVSIMEQRPDASFAYGNDLHCADGHPSCNIDLRTDDVLWRIVGGEQFVEERCRGPEQYIAAGMVLVRTATQKLAGHYRAELPHTDDFEMLLRLALHGPVAYTSAVQGIKRMHGSNRTNRFLQERTRDLAERVAALDSFFSREGRKMHHAEYLHSLGRRSIAERAYWCGIKDLFRGRKSAFELLKFAISLDPKTALVPPFQYLLR